MVVGSRGYKCVKIGKERDHGRKKDKEEKHKEKAREIRQYLEWCQHGPSLPFLVSSAVLSLPDKRLPADIRQKKRKRERESHPERERERELGSRYKFFPCFLNRAFCKNGLFSPHTGSPVRLHAPICSPGRTPARPSACRLASAPPATERARVARLSYEPAPSPMVAIRASCLLCAGRPHPLSPLPPGFPYTALFDCGCIFRPKSAAGLGVYLFTPSSCIETGPTVHRSRKPRPLSEGE